MDEFEKNPSEFSPLPYEGGTCTGDPLPAQNEYDRPEEYPDASPLLEQSSGQQTKKWNRKARFQSKLLLQAAAVMIAVVAITSSFGVDLLGSDALFGGVLSGGILDDLLHNAGAKEGIITISMLWSTTDDMDLHVITPSGDEIFYGNPMAGGGELDVDMQVNEPYVSNPVENIYFTAPEHGTYKIYIHNFTNRTVEDTRVLVRVKIAGRQTKEYYVMVDEWGAQVCSFTY